MNLHRLALQHRAADHRLTHADVAALDLGDDPVVHAIAGAHPELLARIRNSWLASSNT
jgi:hypothetical protein